MKETDVIVAFLSNDYRGIMKKIGLYHRGEPFDFINPLELMETAEKETLCAIFKSLAAGDIRHREAMALISNLFVAAADRFKSNFDTWPLSKQDMSMLERAGLMNLGKPIECTLNDYRRQKSLICRYTAEF